MADLITHSLSFSRESVAEYFIKPLFMEMDIRDLVTIRLDVKSNDKLDLIDNLEKITKAYAQGASFTPSTGVTITQKTLTTADFKAEVQQNGKAFLDQVKQVMLKKGYAENDISSTLFEEIILSIFVDGIAADVQRILWLGDTLKETRSSDIPTGTTDADYNVIDGFWKQVIVDIDATTIPVAQFLDINSTTYLDTAAVAEVDTVTLTGTAGTANVTINGTAYLATFATDLTTTATNFVTSHAATILAREGSVVVTAATTTLVVTSGVAGCQISSAIANVSGNLAGTQADTTPSVATGAVKTDAALAMFKAMYAKMPSTLRKRKAEVKFYVTASIADNYRDTMESSSAGSDSSYNAVIDGIRKMAYRNIEIVEFLSWDDYLDSDFGDCRPHRALLTIPANFIVGMDGASDDTDLELFYDQTTQNNVFRAEWKMGVEYLHEDYIVAAYA